LVYESAEQFAEALATYDRVLERDASNLWVLKRRVAVLVAVQDFVRALEHAMALAARFPLDVDAREHLHALAHRLGRYRDCVRIAEDLLVLRPHDPRYSVWCGDALRACGDPLAARRYFAHAMELRPSRRAAAGLLLCARATPGDAASAPLQALALAELAGGEKRGAPATGRPRLGADPAGAPASRVALEVLAGR
jgi:tetratricopeptide (TPR) repeat protein